MHLSIYGSVYLSIHPSIYLEENGKNVPACGVYLPSHFQDVKGLKAEKVDVFRVPSPDLPYKCCRCMSTITDERWACPVDPVDPVDLLPSAKIVHHSRLSSKHIPRDAPNFQKSRNET